MKFLCSHCKAKYHIADEKVAGRTLRMRCRNCQQEIVIHGDPGLIAPPPPAAYAGAAPLPRAAPAPPPPVSPLGADFQMQVGANLRTPPLPPMDEWHVGINDTPVGPMRREEVAHKLAAGVIGPDSLAWREGLDDWLPIRAIAELAVLCMPGPGAPHPMHAAGQHPELSPIGGRAGAGPAYAIEDWAPVREPNPSQAMAQLGPPTLELGRRGTGMPSLSVMFALAGAFALLTSAVAIFGARWLQSERAPAPAPAAPAQPTPAKAAEPSVPGDNEPAGQMVIDLNDPALQDDSSATAQRRAPASKGSSTQSRKSKKELTDEQKAMLARMGEGTAAPSDLSGLRTQGSGSSGSKASAATLSAQQVSKVVVNGRANLQRCYELALRGAGSDQTVRMNVELTVTPSGNASNVKTSGDGLPGMAQCIERTVRMWRFPSSGASSPVKFPLLFQPGA